MPAEPEVMDEMEIDVEVAQPPAMTLREGEEKFRAGLTLEDHRRRDSLLEQMRKDLAQLESVYGTAAQKKLASSPTARRRQIAQRKLVEQLKKGTFKRGNRWEGACVPATVINFNPVPVTLSGELQAWTIPAAGKGLKVTVQFRGRRFVGSYLTIETPHTWPVHVGTRNDKQFAAEMPDVEYRYLPPLGLAHQFYEHFVEGAADAQGMGGVLIFEGDIHALTQALKKGEAATLWMPHKETTLDGFGDVVYTVEERLFVDCMERLTETQKNYAAKEIADGHRCSIATSDEIRNQLGGYQRLWHNYALEKGYIEKALPWATEQIKDSPKTQAVYCPDCRTRQTDPEQYFCKECNAPFDAFKAFMAGRPVAESYLVTYAEDSEEWAEIVKEIQRRKARIALLQTPNLAAAEPKPAKPLTKEEKKAAAKAAKEAAELAAKEAEEE